VQKARAELPRADYASGSTSNGDGTHGVEGGGGVLFDSRRLVGLLERGLLMALSLLLDDVGLRGGGGARGGLGGRRAGDGLTSGALPAHTIVHAPH
jgi:hypothetical protein